MRRILPLLVLVALAVAGYFLLHGVGWDSLARHQNLLKDWVAGHPIGSAALFLAAYIATVALSLPQAALLTVSGGFLFGAVLGTVLTVIGATTGATILVVVIRTAFAQTLERNRHRIPQRVQTRLMRDGFSYLLAIRLVPLFPFWIVNLACVVVGVRLAVFVPATLLGIVPVTFVLSSIGSGVGTILAQGHKPDLSVLFSPHILLPLLALAAVSLLPTLLRRRPDARV
jgi:uncharacterized membrane protein YdjX (TVP38/TMEM64 family)